MQAKESQGGPSIDLRPPGPFNVTVDGRQGRGEGASPQELPDRHKSARGPMISRFLLDRGIRPESNTCSGDPSEIADGEATSHRANAGQFKVPGREGESWKRHS